MTSAITGEPRVWIGLTSFTNGAFAWADNSPYDYNNFYQGHPDGPSACSPTSCQVGMYTISANANGNWDDFGGSLFSLKAICQEKSSV